MQLSDYFDMNKRIEGTAATALFTPILKYLRLCPMVFIYYQAYKGRKSLYLDTFVNVLQF